MGDKENQHLPKEYKERLENDESQNAQLSDNEKETIFHLASEKYKNSETLSFDEIVGQIITGHQSLYHHL